MSSLISIIQNAGSTYAGAEQEIAKNISYFLTIDDAIASKNDYPLAVPIAGVNYSYEVWIRLRCDLAPNSSVENIKAWYDSGIPAGYTITVNSDIVSAYQQPVNTESTRGTRIDFTTKNAEIHPVNMPTMDAIRNIINIWLNINFLVNFLLNPLA